MMLDDRLQRIIDAKKIPHLLVFYGSTSSLKKEMALLFAQTILGCTEEFHPDLHHYFPEGKLGLHSVQSMKQMCQDIFLTSYRGGYQCFLVHEAERMFPASSHALLKTFEEPPKQTIIILLSTIYSKLLPTIISRSQSFYFEDGHKNLFSIKEKVLNILVDQSLEKIEDIAWNLEKERGDWEKKSNQELEELTAKQKQRIKQESEGQAAIIFQEHLREIFLTLQEFYRDQQFYAFVEKTQLFYPQYLETYKKRKSIALDILQKWIEEAELAIERGIKLHLSLEILFMRLFGMVK